MRSRIAVAVLGSAAVVATTGAALLATTATAGASPVQAAATQQIVVRPVTSSGHAAGGFNVKAEKDGQLDCSYPSASPAAVDNNILECSPSVEYAVACWKSAQAKRALCLRSATSDKLAKIPYTGKFASAAAPKKHQTAAMKLVLADGEKCTIRDGGAWGSLKKHPSWDPTYGCTGSNSGAAVWMTPGERHFGIDESNPAWTVKVANQSGNEKVHTRRVVKAYFVGTAS